MKLPDSLLSSVRDGDVVLYLGNRVFEDALHPNGSKRPDEAGLVRLLSRTFLSGKYDTSRIEHVLEFCEHDLGIAVLHKFLDDVLSPFRPNIWHQIITKFAWRAIISTDVTTVLEKAYAENKESPVRIVPFDHDGQRVDRELVSSRHIPYLKIRGSISSVDPESYPAPFVEQQGGTSGRVRLFERACELALEYPVLFVGNSYEDEDLHNAIRNFCSGKHPRAYAVLQSIGELEERVLRKRRIDTLRLSASEFFESLNLQVEPAWRSLASSVIRKHPIDRHLRIPVDGATPDVIVNVLETGCSYVFQDMPCESVTARAFYRGMSYGWGAVLANLDIRRTITDEVVVSACLERTPGREDAPEQILIKGYAGCGKSVFLKRIALECSMHESVICLFDERLDGASFRALSEIYRLSGKRIILFFDNASQRQDVISEFLKRATDLCVALTIVTTERHSRWNTECIQLHSAEWREFSIRNLSETEIRTLLGLLERHGCLGVLAKYPIEERVQRLSEYAERQLLVALHEATMGASFEQIIINEYRSISDPTAQALYRTICICHRFGIPVRAGLISRVHKIPFEQFKTELFSPLEEIVFAPHDRLNYDRVYRSRHQDIAKIVFEQIIARQDTRLSEYLSLISGLDVDYTVDREAMIALTKARELLEVFSRREDLEAVFAGAKIRVDNEMLPFLFQQMAIMEMRYSGGSLDKASEYIQTSIRLAPRANAIAHTAAEVERLRSVYAKGTAQKIYHKEQAIAMAGELLARDPWDEHAVHTLIKIAVDDLSELMRSSSNPDRIAVAIEKIESQFDRALQKFPDSPILLESASRFRQLVHQDEKALQALRAAVRSAPERVYYARRLAQVEFSSGNAQGAIKTLEDSIKRNPSGVESLYEEMAVILKSERPEQHHEILASLRKAFIFGGPRTSAHYNYAVYEYLHGEKHKAIEVFQVLQNSEVPWRIKKKIRDIQEKVFGEGVVVSADFSTAYVRYAGQQIPAPCSETDDAQWQRVRKGVRVKFTLAFQYMGPIAIRVVPL